ncbi:MAG: hypothetical protein ACREV4_07635, partial [Gammaproteobacteria bacterium]
HKTDIDIKNSKGSDVVLQLKSPYHDALLPYRDVPARVHARSGCAGCPFTGTGRVIKKME